MAYPFLLIVALMALLWPISAATKPLEKGCDVRHTDMLYTVTLLDVPGGSGSATVIYSAKRDDNIQTYLLTNHHVIKSAITIVKEWSPKKGKKIDVERRSQVEAFWQQYNQCSRSVGKIGRRAEIIAYDEGKDLGLVRLIDRERIIEYVARLVVEDDPIYLGEDVWAIGAGMGEPPFMTRGEIGFLERQINSYSYMLSTAPIIFGNSGGALFRLGKDGYELIGVPARVSGVGFQAITHMGWSIPPDTIYTFLREQGFCFILGEPDCPIVDEKDEDVDEEEEDNEG